MGVQCNIYVDIFLSIITKNKHFLTLYIKKDPSTLLTLTASIFEIKLGTYGFPVKGWSFFKCPCRQGEGVYPYVYIYLPGVGGWVVINSQKSVYVVIECSLWVLLGHFVDCTYFQSLKEFNINERKKIFGS